MKSDDTATAQQPDRREARRQERHTIVIAGARGAFSGNGYTAMSMSNLLKILGGSRATLCPYFPSKKALFAAVQEDAAKDRHGKLADPLAADMNQEEGVNNLARTLVAIFRIPKAHAIRHLAAAEGVKFPEPRRLSAFLRTIHIRIRPPLDLVRRSSCAPSARMMRSSVMKPDTLISFRSGPVCREIMRLFLL